MDISFGIITDGKSDNFLNLIVDSIEKQLIPNYEIIIVGDTKIDRKNVSILEFNEGDKELFGICKKKNLITKNSKYENIVYSHDYIIYLDGWYNGYLKFGNNFKICMNKILNYNGTRFRDWTIWPHNENEMDSLIKRECIIPYDITHLSKYMYISGSWWMSKKDVMEEFPLNEDLNHCEGEDVEWSKRVREKYDFSINTYSSVKCLKQKGISFEYASLATYNKLKKFGK